MPTATATAVATATGTAVPGTLTPAAVVWQLSDGSNAADALVTVVLVVGLLLVFALGFMMWAHLPTGGRR